MRAPELLSSCRSGKKRLPAGGGFREGKGIWGNWEILWDARGGFHIWPRSFAEANEEAVSAEEEMPAPAFKV
jgi:hypothetical protein